MVGKKIVLVLFTATFCFAICKNGEVTGADRCFVCWPQFTGSNCDIPCTCVHGTCNNDPPSAADPTCGNGTCSEGMIGSNCDSCDVNRYGGRCGRCLCRHGTCDDGFSGTGHCITCSHGWYGIDCDTNEAPTVAPTEAPHQTTTRAPLPTVLASVPLAPTTTLAQIPQQMIYGVVLRFNRPINTSFVEAVVSTRAAIPLREVHVDFFDLELQEYLVVLFPRAANTSTDHVDVQRARGYSNFYALLSDNRFDELLNTGLTSFRRLLVPLTSAPPQTRELPLAVLPVEHENNRPTEWLIPIVILASLVGVALLSCSLWKCYKSCVALKVERLQRDTSNASEQDGAYDEVLAEISAPPPAHDEFVRFGLSDDEESFSEPEAETFNAEEFAENSL